MMPEAGALDPADETFRECERVVDPNIRKEYGQKQNSFPRSFFIATLELQYDILRTEETPSSRVLCES